MRPYLSNTMGLQSQFMQHPWKPHLDAVRRTLRYVRAKLDHALFYAAYVPVELHGYIDADWAGSTTDLRSSSGFMFTLGSAAITWSSKNQLTIALSSTEAECRGTAVAACENLSFAVEECDHQRVVHFVRLFTPLDLEEEGLRTFVAHFRKVIVSRAREEFDTLVDAVEQANVSGKSTPTPEFVGTLPSLFADIAVAVQENEEILCNVDGIVHAVKELQEECKKKPRQLYYQ
ncbi:hypothetical protein L7F22_069203 [Adiantum nelumboides]|nr:hypothetical protein [Adiantum nelumboides]